MKGLQPSHSSQQAKTRAKQMQRTHTSVPECIARMRADLAAEFGPRADRAAQRFEGTQAYETIGGVSCLTLTPAVQTSQTVLLYFFGGGYVSGAPEYELPIVTKLCTLCGMTVVLPRYPLAPEHPAPAALEAAQQVHKALVKRHPILLSGESAGGGLALCLLETLDVLPKAICLFSPWVDLTDAAHENALDHDPTLSSEQLRHCAGAYRPCGDMQAVSPSFLSLPELPPMLITTGTRDIMLPSLKAFQARHGGQLEIWPALWHVFELYDELPEATRSLDMVARFLSENA